MIVSIYETSRQDNLLEVEINGMVCNHAVHIADSTPFKVLEDSDYSLYDNSGKGAISLLEYFNREYSNESITLLATFEVSSTSQIIEHLQQYHPELFI